MSDTPIIFRRLRRRSKKLTIEDVEIAKSLLGQGYTQHEAAALIGVNQGRISEALNGKLTPIDDPIPDLFK
ncbi:XRE family transcriptional regulator [Azorhizobium doebereinerae]|uniref:XRE family transcriptional regulator n=1 Tax=Azorhizobium doebereinerae TaxID=281091 RepID=UPI0012EB3301|nr:hypothetical protein [Azorhizobium doebereinerae]